MQPLDQYPELAAAAAALPADLLRAAAQRLAISAGRTGENDLPGLSIAELRHRVEELDLAAFDLRDRADDGELMHMDRYVRMFRRARAAESWLALHLEELTRSIYESLHALGADETVVLGELQNATDSRP